MPVISRNSREELLRPLWDLNKNELETYGEWVKKLSEEELDLTKLKCLIHRNAAANDNSYCPFCSTLEAEEFARNF